MPPERSGRRAISFPRGGGGRGRAARSADARRKFLEIAESEARPATAERARYLAAWISEEEEDLETATEQFGKLAGARDEQVRQAGGLRRGFGRERQGRYAEAVCAVEA